MYNHELQDVFLIQEQIAQAIVEALQLELLGETSAPLVSPGTDSMQAYDKYLEGRDVLQKRTPMAARKAISIFEEALEFDPDYAQAYAGLADSWIVLRDVGNLTLLEATLPAHDAISKALQLNNSLPEAQASLGLCILGGGERSEAARQFQKAIDLDPEYSGAYLLQANLLRDRGFLTEATRVYTQAIALDPLNAAILENQAVLYAFQGRFTKAIEQLNALALRDPGRLTGLLSAAQVWALAGDNEKALHNSQKAVELAPKSPVALAALVESNLRLGNLDRAQAALKRMYEAAPNNETAINTTMRFYLMTGDFDALDQLATSRVEEVIDNQDGVGTEFLFERVSWAAVAQLGLSHASSAVELFEKANLDLTKLDPRPATVRSVALWARAMALKGDLEGATGISTTAGQLAERVLAQGSGGGQLDYALACVAAATNSSALALEHLQKAKAAGWNNFVFANHDPTLADIVRLPEYGELSVQGL